MSEEQPVVESGSHDDNADSSPAPEAEVKTEEVNSEEVKTEAAPTEKPQKGFQKRINQLTAEKHEERLKNQELEKRIKDLESNVAKAKPDLVAPNPDDFETDQEYNTANANYYAEVSANAADARISAKEQEVRQQEQQSTKEAIANKYWDKVESVSDSYENFEEIAHGHKFQDSSLTYMIADLDKGPEVAYHLGSNLDEAERIFNLPEVQRMRELTKLEYQVESLKPKVVSEAPDPITPLGNSEQVDTVGVNGDNIKNADEWLKWRQSKING
jgi:hypothetical protein